MAARQTIHDQAPDTFAAALSARFLHCRELGHDWRPNTASYNRREKTYDRTITCRSCRTDRHQVLDRTGSVLANSYTYPDGYLAKDVEPGTLSRDVFRLEAVQRQLHLSERRVS